MNLLSFEFRNNIFLAYNKDLEETHKEKKNLIFGFLFTKHQCDFDISAAIILWVSVVVQMKSAHSCSSVSFAIAFLSKHTCTMTLCILLMKLCIFYPLKIAFSYTICKFVWKIDTCPTDQTYLHMIKKGEHKFCVSCAAWSTGWVFFLDTFRLIFAVQLHKIFFALLPPNGHNVLPYL